MGGMVPLTTAADGVLVGVAVTAKVLTENISMQATVARAKAFFIEGYPYSLDRFILRDDYR
ncbi:MAG: hypothetical protein ABR902_13870 [Candidatus Korobacteraceae bacterium]